MQFDNSDQQDTHRLPRYEHLLLGALLPHFAHARSRAQNMGVVTDTSEFRYLPGQAQTLAVPVPSVQRLTLSLPDARELSTLCFGSNSPTVTYLHGAGLN